MADGLSEHTLQKIRQYFAPEDRDRVIELLGQFTSPHPRLQDCVRDGIVWRSQGNVAEVTREVEAVLRLHRERQEIPVELSEAVQAEIHRRFSPEDQESVSALLQQFTPYPNSNMPEEDRLRLQDRVHRAILALSEGSVEKVAAHVDEALVDWRDVLVWAGDA